MITISLVAIALILTLTLFTSRNMLLGYPAAMFWGLTGGQFYQLSSATWDIEYLTFFACMGMVIFCVLAMYALRKRDLDTEVPDWLDTEEFADEGKKGRKTEKVNTEIRSMWEDSDDEMESQSQPRVTSERAQERRKSPSRKKKQTGWGEFGSLQ